MPLLALISAQTPADISTSSENPAPIQKKPKRTAEANSENTKTVPRSVKIRHDDSHPPRPGYRSEVEAEHKKESRIQQFSGTFFTAVSALLSFITLIVVGFQLEAAQLSQRAWVIGNPEFSNFTGPPEAGDCVFYPASFKNIGKTPARIADAGVSLKTTTSFEEIPREPRYGPYEITAFNGLLLVPGDSFALTAQPMLLGPADYALLRDQKLFLYAHGFIRYTDVFRRRRQTTFCHYYRVPVGVSFGEGFIRCLKAPPKYNRAT